MIETGTYNYKKAVMRIDTREMNLKVIIKYILLYHMCHKSSHLCKSMTQKVKDDVLYKRVKKTYGRYCYEAEERKCLTWKDPSQCSCYCGYRIVVWCCNAGTVKGCTWYPNPTLPFV